MATDQNSNSRRGIAGRVTLVLGLGIAAAVIGCGGSGGGTTGGGTQLTGNPAFRAAAISSYQALGAGVGYPYEALQVSAPTGNKVPFGVGNSLKSVLAVAQQLRSGAVHPSLTTTSYDSELNLYVGSIGINGSVYTVPFYVNSAATQSAGTIVITLPGASTSYTSYPATVTMVVNITAGNILCKGSAQIVYTSASGANTLTGTFTLANTNVVEKLNLSLDDSFNVTGSVTLQESNATVAVTDVNGSMSGDIPCNISVSPTNLTGTGTLNLLTGAVTLNLKTATGTATASINSSGNLVLNYADGTTETVTNPASAPLTSSSGGSTTTTGSTTSTGTTTTGTSTTGTTGNTPVYQAPIYVAAGSVGLLVGALNSSGQFLASGPSGGIEFSASSLSSPISFSGAYAPVAQNDSGVITGAFGEFWPNASSPYQTLLATGYQSPQGTTYVSDAGVFVSQIGSSQLLAWTSPTATPVLVPVPSGSSSIVISSMAPSGAFVGVSGSSSLEYWSSYTANPTPLSVPASFNPTNAANDGFSVAIANGGPIALSTYYPAPVEAGAALYFSSPTSTGTLLPALNTGDVLSVTGVNTAGVTVGLDTQVVVNGTSTVHAVRWVNGKIQDLNTLIPNGSGWVLDGAASINASGWIVGNGTYKGATALYLLKPIS